MSTPFKSPPSAWRAAALVLPTLITLAVPSSAHAVFWSAKPSADGRRFDGCVKVDASVDDALKTLSASDPTCHLDMSLGALAVGYFIRCGASAIMAFRSERDCHTVMAKLIANESLEPVQLAPPGTKSPSSWVNWMTGCLPKALDGLAVAHGRIEASARYCECLAAWGGNLAGDEDLLKREAEFKLVLTKCVREHVHGEVTADLASALWSLVVAASNMKDGKTSDASSKGTPAGETAPAPAPGPRPPTPAAREGGGP